MEKQCVLKLIEETKIVGIVRKVPKHSAYHTANALVEGGLKVLEFTAETPQIASIIEDVKSKLPDTVAVGVGTVLDGETARIMILAGADFIVTPTLNRSTMEVCLRYGKPVIPGAMTPTEILTAYTQGADYVKVFPADVLGPGFFKSLKGPLGHIPLMATGGISKANAKAYLDAGSAAVGVGGSLVPAQAVADKDYGAIKKAAKQLVGSVEGRENL
ncbi:MAG: bifunctional 4-hydroxy-2-oxoglutarate aldolase/2-dehydro-3-deoxy-phosphogluconate aldolase [Firmicutes bacterium]|nr:bifunctional 4-hydroxy-2-oxoglutarate aldolase/2-dehydro-3-deoxy-phosphogluconate aldolase [Bacillota bacterium]